MGTEIAIIGGGICGLTTAIALERRGFKPTVYESTETYRPAGAGILLQTNALSVLAKIGIADRIRSCGAEISEVPFRSRDGTHLLSFDLEFEENRYGHRFIAIHRGKLQELLLAELDTTVRTGKECVSISTPETPAVTFSDGATIRPDVVIGADGIGSVVRSELYPDATPRPAECIAYRGVAPISALPDRSEPGFEVWGEGSFVGCAPLGDRQVYWYATTTAPISPEGTALDRREALTRRFNNYPDPIPQSIAATSPEAVIRTQLADLAPLDRWSTGAVTLAGDAAHAMLPFIGQGAAQGIEDATILAVAFEANESPKAACTEYEARRKSRAEQFVAASRRLGRVATLESEMGCRLRNLLLWLVPSQLTRRVRAEQATPNQYQR
jgi:2-polyprenyl-6-methoxyphenol hydroxylase-like FAD-dependent oxidoreductase